MDSRFREGRDSELITVNIMVVSDPRVSFGGIKSSKFGRELSRYGMLEFVNIKSVSIYDEKFFRLNVFNVTLKFY